MIKRLIFDVDNTLIDWNCDIDEIIIRKCYELENINASEKLVKKTIKCINNYEKKNNYYKKDLFLKHINNCTHNNLSMNFVNNYFKYSIEIGTPNELPRDEIRTLQYLSSKYELVILTNWFKDVQVERLKKVDILKYFSEVYATEDFKTKPHKESFFTAIGNDGIDECCMIGDDYNSDIKGAINIGLSTVHFNRTNKKSAHCININNFEDLSSVF